MIPYNIKTVVITENCTAESVTGYYCHNWEKTEITTYNYFDTFYLYGKIILGFVVIAIIINMKKKKIRKI